ncbi:hypothetical protein P152DRAFT_453436 [Eremomyces bilateralis CBS 781.70]|uniref:HTH APSES-type domain-containing protein n=1 Tax=Eremomyces bilateralis CBS 781.70 TaxID=1392243 RepID=A0A6G1GFL1_9PEZI|nr:uncharacterized protein P152DRAFT_453436 [Eremomyces bilateralis CBS 781.70]KAF1816814.1 hypothetical protein P152DRAFT_453436 [Eremomyces bilateralis CBS 781.70]
MAPKRDLPEKRNPLVDAEHTPPQEILTERRKLGQTDLSVKPGQAGVANASNAENLGKFDYAHLRVPLPKDLKGSGIFTAKNQTYPESYFLMRRSSDGFISATGMFKAAFPWASVQEETTERFHHKSLKSAGPSEVAGNVWISPLDALKLSDEYKMLPWIIALLSSENIEKPGKDAHLDISSPPDYNVPPRFLKKEMEESTNPADPPSGASLPPPTSARRRELRSASPSKTSGTPARKIASPRKRTVKKDATPTEDGKAAATEKPSAGKSRGASAASKTLQQVVTNGSTAVAGETSAPATGPNDRVQVEVDEAVLSRGPEEVTTTAVRVEIPAEHPDLPLPQDTGDLVATASEMVSEAKKLEGPSKKRGAKRKAEEIEVEKEGEAEEAVEVAAGGPSVKKAKTEAVVKKEKVRTRAYAGLAATLAVGAGISFFFG